MISFDVSILVSSSTSLDPLSHDILTSFSYPAKTF